MYQNGTTHMEATITGSLFIPPLDELIEKARKVAATRGPEAGFEWPADRVSGAQGYVVNHIDRYVGEKERRRVRAFVEQVKATG